MSDSETLIKGPIREIVRARAGLLAPPPDGPSEEYPLRVGADARRFRADWAFRLAGGGWLFIEDDDAARALHNVAKYWLWMERQQIREPVHLVHLVGPGAADVSAFVAGKAMASAGLHYARIAVADWHAPESWRGALESVLDGIAGAPGGDGAGWTQLRDDPAVGMWADRDGADGDLAARLRGAAWDRSAE